MAIKKVGVAGGGLMGSGIAQSAAQAGYDVLLAEVNQELLDKGMQRVHGAWQMLTGKGKITEEQATEYRGRIRGTLDLAEFGDRDLVIEAIIENLDEKKRLFTTLDAIVPAGSIIDSHTSSLPLPHGSFRAAGLRRPRHHALRRRGDLQGVSRPGLRAADAAAPHGGGGPLRPEEQQGLLRRHGEGSRGDTLAARGGGPITRGARLSGEGAICSGRAAEAHLRHTLRPI